MHAIEWDAGRLEQIAGLARLSLAVRGQLDIDPAREAVLEIPLALAVADKRKNRHGRAS
jgi:hypothetical protein